MLSVAVLVFTDKEVWQDAASLSPGGERVWQPACERGQLPPGFPRQRAWKSILQESEVVLALFYRPDKS